MSGLIQQGYKVTFFTAEGRRHGRHPMGEWLLDALQTLGIRGATLTAGVKGIGRDGKLHSAHFFELADQPLEVTVVLTAAQCQQLFDWLEAERADVFFTRQAVDFGVLGAGGR